jgi:hypothetical protein
MLPTVREGNEASESEGPGLELSCVQHEIPSVCVEKSALSSEGPRSPGEDGIVDAEHDEVAIRAAAMTGRDRDESSISGRRRRVVQDNEQDVTHGAMLHDIVHFPLTFWILVGGCVIVYGKCTEMFKLIIDGANM